VARYFFRFNCRPVHAASSTWALDGDGNWSVASNWTSGVPNTSSDTASFVGVISQDRTVNQDIAGLTINTIVLNHNSRRFTLSGNSITLAQTPTGQSPLVTVTTGGHTISAGLMLNNATTITGNPSTTLTLSGIINGITGAVLNKGNGSLVMSGGQSNIYSGNTFTTGGVLRLAKTAGAVAIPAGTTLTIGRMTPTILTGSVIFDQGGNLGASVAVVVNEGSQIDGGSNFTVVGNTLTLNGGSVINANLRLLGNVTAGAASIPSTIDGAPDGTTGLDFFGNLRTFTINSGTAPGLQVNAPITNGGILKAGFGSMWITSSNNSYTGATIVNDGSLVAQCSLIRTSSITLSGSSRLVLDTLGTRVIRTPTVTIADNARLDLRDNKLIFSNQSVGAWNGSAYTDVTGYIASGRTAAADWNGTGIVTSMTSATAAGEYTSIGIATGQEAKGITSGTALWAGQTVSASNALVMYTYGGDANLDGKLNIDDYIKIDTGISAGLKGWSNGDFNYDGKINIDDYTTVIDANIGNQNGLVFPTAGGIDRAAAIPEPGGGALAGIALLALARRRRRGRG
jgi:autotransporter-associated beta strand protein